MALLSLQNLSLNFGDAQLLDDASAQIERGERVCLLGRNGAGKSSLLKLVAGEVKPDGGEVVLSKGAVVARLPQEVPGDAEGTVFEIIQGDSSAETHEVESLISRLGLDGDAQFSALSGGLKRRAWLGRTLASQPDVLLLDEPTNHLDIESIGWLEDFLVRQNLTLVFVTHDRAFLRKLATRILEIDRGQLLNWDCDYDTYLERKEAALEAEAKQSALFDKRLKVEEAWIRRGVEARRTKSQARIRDLVAMRVERKARREKIGSVGLQAQDAMKSGRLVVEARNVGFSYGERAILDGFSTVVMRGDKIGIIGPNGSGKTTLLKLLLGQIEPQNGEIRLGTNLQIAYFDQLRATLDEEATVQFNVSGLNDTIEFNGERRHVVGYLNEFLFSSQRIRTLVKFLSGGERNRLLLAKLFATPANVLVMDEPTNDLDIETLDVLEELLVGFNGTLLMVSHDRAFLNDVVSSTIVFEGDAENGFQIGEYAGGYDDYLSQRPATEVVAPKVAPRATGKNGGAPKSRKLSFKETRELETLPVLLEELEKEQVELGEKLADPQFYKNDDGTQSAQLTARLAQIEAELARCFARWEELLALEAGV